MDYVCESIVSQADIISNCISRTCKDDCDSKFFNSSTAVANGKERDNCYLYCEAQLPKGRAFQIQCYVDFRKSMEWKCPAYGDPTTMKFTSDECDCDTPIEATHKIWFSVCLALGLLGFCVAFLLTGIPAMISALQNSRCTAARPLAYANAVPIMLSAMESLPVSSLHFFW
jgi:hypothetical protein